MIPTYNLVELGLENYEENELVLLYWHGHCLSECEAGHSH